MRVIDVLDHGAAAHPDRACLVFGEQVVTYAQLQATSCLIAQRLQTLPHPVRHAAVLAPNDADGFGCALGVLRAGITWLPVNARDAAPAIGEQLRRLDAGLLFVHSSFAGMRAELQTAAPGLHEIVVYDTALKEWLGEVPDTDVATTADPEAIVAIFATSGTSGMPKGVELSARAFATFIEAFDVINPHGDQVPVYLAAAPLTHVSGRICLSVMGAGGTTIVLERATPAAILDALEAHKVTMTFLPPTAIYALLADARSATLDLPDLRYLGYGSAPMRVDMIKRALDVFGPVLMQGYGQTEAPMLISSLSPADHLVDGMPAPDRRLSSVGRPTAFTELAILDDDGRPASNLQTGEICVRGDYLMTGYYRDPAATADVSRGGWHHTGDVGFLDEEGYLHIVDRLRDMIITGGFNVYPAEVEAVLFAHPGVRECAVVGVPDERWGELVTAVIVLDDDNTPDADELTTFCRHRLGAVKTPKAFITTPALPRTATGKIRKQALKEQMLSPAASDLTN